MSDAAAAAPATTPATAVDSAPSTQDNAASSGAPEKATGTEKTTAQEWDASAESQLFELMKRSPYGKFKANGKEEVLDAPEKLKSALLDAARGRGASKMAEEAKREKAEAAAVKQRAELLERALEGDSEALRKLGRERPDERESREKAMAELPPEVRELLQEHLAVKQELARRDQLEAEARQQQERNRLQALQARYRDEGLAIARNLVSKLGTPETAEAMLPYVLGAWRDLTAVGLEAGVDVTEDQVIERARLEFEADTEGRFSKLSPKTLVGSALKRLTALPPTEALAGLDDKTVVLWAKELARRIGSKRGQQNQQTSGAAAPTQSRQQVESIARQPLSPFRWK